MNFIQNISPTQAIKAGKNSYGKFKFYLDVSKLSNDDTITFLDLFKEWNNHFYLDKEQPVDVYFNNVFPNGDGIINPNDVLAELARLTKERTDKELIEQSKNEQIKDELIFLKQEQKILNRSWWKFWA